RSGLGEIPEPLVHLPYNGKNAVHARIRLAAEEVLDHALAGPEAVVDRTPAKALLAQATVDAAAVVGGEVRAGPPGRLVDREVGRGGEGRHDAAQPKAARTVGPQVESHPFQPSCVGWVDAGLADRTGHRGRLRCAVLAAVARAGAAAAARAAQG